MGRNVEDVNTYRVGHQLAQRVLQQCLALDTPIIELRFSLTKSGKKLSLLEPHAGKSGWLVCSKFTVESFEAEDHILFAGIRDDGTPLDSTACKRLFDLPAEVGPSVLPVPVPDLDLQIKAAQERVIQDIGMRNNSWLDQEVGKLDRWTEDLKLGLEQEIRDLDQQIREAKRVSVAAATLADKLVHQRALKMLQTTRNQRRKDLFVAQDEVEARRDALIADIETRMTKGQKEDTLFRVRWSLT
jgi:adenine-specific DNA-methyltransferase